MRSDGATSAMRSGRREHGIVRARQRRRTRQGRVDERQRRALPGAGSVALQGDRREEEDTERLGLVLGRGRRGVRNGRAAETMRLEAERAGEDRVSGRSVAAVEQRKEGTQGGHRRLPRATFAGAAPGGDARVGEQGLAESVARFSLDAVGEDAQRERRVDEEQRLRRVHAGDAGVAAEVVTLPRTGSTKLIDVLKSLLVTARLLLPLPAQSAISVKLIVVKGTNFKTQAVRSGPIGHAKSALAKLMTSTASASR